jgi:phosphoribosylaminoimidazole carboxylase PurE protein
MIGIITGSKSDVETLQPCFDLLEKLSVPYEFKVLSAHRTPGETIEYARSARSRGVKVIIAAAGLSAALPGVIAAHTDLPVIGIPIASGPLSGIDALLSIVQMPGGVPVAAVSIGSAGAKNAAVLAARIMALSDARLADRLAKWAAAQADEVKKASKDVERTFKPLEK